MVRAKARAIGPSRRKVGVMVGVLVLGTVTGLVVGGATPGFGGKHSGNAASARVPSAQASASSNEPPVPGSAPLQHGTVVADPAASTLTTAVALGRTHTLDGAAAAFTAYATWLVGSPAADANPSTAASVVGGKLLNATDSGLVAAMPRHQGDRFDPQRGAYRVIAHAGDEASPSQVMVEVTAPLKLAGKTQWDTIGGVVGWTADGWQLVSIEPRATLQPATPRDDVRGFTDQERAHTFAGLGWRAYRLVPGR